jgi:hypothetical protein
LLDFSSTNLFSNLGSLKYKPNSSNHSVTASIMSDATPQAPASSGVTEADLKSKITEKLQATHIEIHDPSGTSFS